MSYAIKIKGFTADRDHYLPCSDSDEIDTFPTRKDAEKELVYIEARGFALMGDCEIVAFDINQYRSIA